MPFRFKFEPNLVICTFEGRTLGLEDQRAMFEQFERALQLKKPFAGLISGPALLLGPPGLVSAHMAWTKAHSEALRQYCRGLVVVTSNSLMRGMFKSLISLASFATPHVLFATEEEARAWVREQLNKPKEVAAAAGR